MCDYAALTARMKRGRTSFSVRSGAEMPRRQSLQL